MIHDMRYSRIGHFRVSEHLVFLQPAAFAAVLAKMGFVPLAVDRDLPKRHFKYTGTSPMFDALDLDGPIPIYDVIITNLQDVKSVDDIVVTVKK